MEMMELNADINGPFTIRGGFERPERAREAMVSLEGRGLDADQIGLQEQPASIPTREATRSADMTVVREIAGRYLRGGVLGAAVGGVLLAMIVWLIGVDGMAAVIAAGVAGAIGGFLLGGFWGGARRLPVNEQAFDTLTIDPNRPELVVVRVRAETPRDAELAENVLRAHGALMVDR
jgi:hypothetical protein